MRNWGLSTAVAILATMGTWSLVVSADLDPTANLNSLANNTLFTRWRPRYHFLAPAGWMNDPCGAMYDPTRKEYHLMYQARLQWHSNHVGWGNISWGHAVSKDLVTWTDVGRWRNDGAAAISPGPKTKTPYDHLSIFSGTAQPVNLAGHQDGTLLAFYTSIRALPTNWQLPYIKGTESQSFAISHDGGRTWGKYAGNPVIESPPKGWNITGWRDPFFEPWPEMDMLLHQKEPHYYMVAGSGIKGVGPRLPFYSAPASNLTKWTFQGALWEPKMNESFGNVEVTGSYGFNFEVPGFFSLVDDIGDIHYYSTMGAEGGNITTHTRWALWTEGSVTKRSNGSAELSVHASGVGDWGTLYAMTSFNDTKNNRRVQWGWADEDSNNYGILAQGFAGSMGLPRELFVHKTYNILPESSFPIGTKSSSTYTQHANGTFSASTLGIRPLKDVVGALQRGGKLHTAKSGNRKAKEWLKGVESENFHIFARISNPTGPVGFIVRATQEEEEYTAIVYSPEESQIYVDRSHSSLIKQFNNYTNTGYFYAPLLSHKGRAVREAVELDVFVDGSMVEVFANERFALTTRIYPSKDSASRMGLYVGDGSEAVFSDVKVWTDLRNVWPDRPRDSSSHLVFDTPAETGNYSWWAGW